jgi:MFS transporter, ACDE family, multidrug resistance protein
VALLDHPGTARDKLMGWRSSAISVGGVIWPLLGGAVGAISWHAPFAIYLLGVPLALASWWVLPGTHAPKDAPAPSQRATPRSFSLARVTWRGWMTPALLGVYGLQLVAAVLLYGFIVFVPLRLAEVGITAPARVAVFAAASSAAMTAVGLIYARVRTAMGHRPVLTFALGTLGLALGVLGLTASSTLMLTAAVMFGAGMGLVVPTLTVQVGEQSPAEVRGQATALLASVTFAGQVVAPLVLGPVHAATSVRGAFLTAATLAAVTLALVAAPRRSSRTACSSHGLPRPHSGCAPPSRQARSATTSTSRWPQNCPMARSTTGGCCPPDRSHVSTSTPCWPSLRWATATTTRATKSQR